MHMIRRAFLEGCWSASIAPAALSIVACEPTSGLGPLVLDPDELLDLPEGFSYVVLERSGDVMSDGHAVGARPDGMACFYGPGGTWILLRNHELDAGAAAVPEVAYDPNQLGGVTRLVIDRETLERKSSNWVLVGTSRNCAGGPSPWGWLSCEETTSPNHGYVFLCDPEASSAREPQRAPSLGRFKHEAVGVDPETNIIYLTEDEKTSCLYRHVPTDGPFVGRLEALRIPGEDGKDLGLGLRVGDQFEVDWVPVDDPESSDPTPFEQASEHGAAIINRGEGLWFSDGSVFFVSTAGGPAGRGQVFRLDPTEAGGTLTLIAQAEADDVLVNPDNITVAPNGDIFVVEDNDGPNHIRCIGQDGKVETFARNARDGGTGELCGVCFSPDGAVMFVNMQEEGLTLAITGPFVNT